MALPGGNSTGTGYVGEGEFIGYFSADEKLIEDAGEEDFIDDFSAEDKFFTYVKIPSAMLSLACSVFIVQHVARTRLFAASGTRQRTRVRQGKCFPRMLIGLCAFDGFSSLALILEPIVALGTPQLPVGHWTCTASGFTKMAGVTCGATYNALISVYFYLVVVRSWTDDYVVKWFEPAGHAFVAMWFLFWVSGMPLEVRFLRDSAFRGDSLKSKN